MPVRVPHRLVAMLVALATGLSTHAGADAPRPVIAIEHVAVVDVARSALSAPRTVTIANGRIVAIEEPAAAAIPPEAVRVDGRGRYLIPGLVDMHVHLFNSASGRPPNDWAFPLFVANGVTAVRDMHTLPAFLPTVARWRAAATSGELVAPRVIAVGTGLSGDDAVTLRRRVREAHAAGADFVKTFSELPAPMWRDALYEARALNLPVHGHIPASVSPLAAAQGGQRSAEHLMQVYEACSSHEQRWLASRQGLDGRALAGLRDRQERAVLESFDAAACASAAAALARVGMAQIPTLVLSYAESHREPRYRDDTRWRLLRSDEQARWQRILDAGTAEDANLGALRRDVSRRIIAALHAAGVPIIAGTDAPMPLVYPGYSLHDELARLVDAGLTPAAALRAATLTPAELLALEKELGSVAVGWRADLVLLDADPLTDIGNARLIYAVVLDGRLLRRAELDALLAPAADSPARGANAQLPPSGNARSSEATSSFSGNRSPVCARDT